MGQDIAAHKRHIASIMYETYCGAVGGRAFNGDPLPPWKEFSEDPKKAVQAQGWLAAASAAIDAHNEAIQRTRF